MYDCTSAVLKCTATILLLVTPKLVPIVLLKVPIAECVLINVQGVYASQLI